MSNRATDDGAKERKDATASTNTETGPSVSGRGADGLHGSTHATSDASGPQLYMSKWAMPAE